MGRRDVCKSSDLITASAGAPLVVATTNGMLCSVNCIIATTGNIDIYGYDSSSGASGALLYRRKITSTTVIGTAGGSRLDVFAVPVSFQTGLVFTVTGTAPDGVIVTYTKE